MCGIQFSHGEARLQQWGNRETNHHYVQEAVETVSRQRESVIREAADTEVLLPFTQDRDQASTAVPPDDERDLFGREDAPRMDEEIIDFQWFPSVSWDSIKDLRGTTYVQSPATVQVCAATGATCNSPCHHAQQLLLPGL